MPPDHLGDTFAALADPTLDVKECDDETAHHVEPGDP